MKQNKKQLIIGCILFLLGLGSLLASLFRIDCTLISIFIFGLALMFLYQSKQKRWALLIGCIAVTACIAGMIFKIPTVEEGLCSAILIVIPSIVYIYTSMKKYNGKTVHPGKLIFAAFAVWAGVYIALTSFSIMQPAAGPLFFFCCGMAAFCISFITRKMYGIIPIIICAVCCLFAIICMIGNPHLPLALTYSTNFLSLALILISVIMIVEAVKGKWNR